VNGLSGRVPVFVAAFWWGSLTTIGFVVVPLLFAHLPTPSIAGAMAARLFTAQSWIALACGLLLIIISRGKEAVARMDWAQGALVFVALGVLLALLLEFAVAPRIMARQNLQLWHMAGTAMVAAQWLCAGVVLWKTATRSAAPS